MIATIFSTKLVKQSEVEYDSQNCGTSLKAIDLASKLMGDSPNEQIYVILLDVKNNVIGAHQVSIGTVNMSLCHPREFFRPAILANACSVIMAHNHPSGDLNPSKDDWACYRKLKSAGQILGIEVVDSVIVNPWGKGMAMASQDILS